MIGSSLAAAVILYANDAMYDLLSRLGSELRFILMISAAKVLHLQDAPAECAVHDTLGIAIQTEVYDYIKCERCWHRSEDIGVDPQHEDLCGRCIGNITGHDEVRLFA